MKRLSKYRKQWLPLSWRDTWVTLAVFAVITLGCFLLWKAGVPDNVHALLYVVSVLIVSRLTRGYFFGIVTSILAVIGVNYAFTYPYFALDFSITGYPLTFLVMLGVALTTCAMTTRIQEQERLRRETEKETLRANLLRAISHDLRTPLTSIEGSVGAVLDNQDSFSPEQTRELLSDTRESARWLIRMVENLLSITRMGADPTGASIVKTEELAEEILAEVTAKFRKKHPELKVCVSVPEEPLLVSMDAMLIEQVLTNLMENAAEHGKTTTTIDIRVYEEENDAVFSVTDDGSGIEDEKLPGLLKGYLATFGETRSADQHRNMGIGLSVCSSIITAHGGSLSGHNRKDGHGAEFVFRLPMTERTKEHGDP